MSSSPSIINLLDKLFDSVLLEDLDPYFGNSKKSDTRSWSKTFPESNRAYIDGYEVGKNQGYQDAMNQVDLKMGDMVSQLHSYESESYPVEELNAAITAVYYLIRQDVPAPNISNSENKTSEDENFNLGKDHGYQETFEYYFEKLLENLKLEQSRWLARGYSENTSGNYIFKVVIKIVGKLLDDTRNNPSKNHTSETPVEKAGSGEQDNLKTYDNGFQDGAKHAYKEMLDELEKVSLPSNSSAAKLTRTGFRRAVEIVERLSKESVLLEQNIGKNWDEIIDTAFDVPADQKSACDDTQHLGYDHDIFQNPAYVFLKGVNGKPGPETESEPEEKPRKKYFRVDWDHLGENPVEDIARARAAFEDMLQQPWMKPIKDSMTKKFPDGFDVPVNWDEIPRKVSDWFYKPDSDKK